MVLCKNSVLLKLMGDMDEPVKKKCRLEDTAIDTELEMLQEHLLQNCLCSLPESTLRKLFCWFHSTDVLWSELTADWYRDRVLMLITCLQLICEVTRKQYAQGKVCPRLAEIRNALIHEENKLIDFVIELADYPDPFILFAAGRALTSFFIVMEVHIDQRWLDKLTESIEECSRPSKMSFSLDVLKRLMEWKDFDEHTLEDNTPEEKRNPSICHTLSVESEQFDCTEVKWICIKSLGPKWPSIVIRFDNLMKTDSKRYQSCIVTFLNLWKAIVSVKANLSVKEIEPFYMYLNCYVALLSNTTSAIVWKHILSLFNEVLCYGSTFSLLENLDEKPCELAHIIVRSVKDRQLLNMVPYKEGSDSFGGTKGGDGDKVLLKKMVLLVLKAVAVTVKETRYDSSSDSSVGSEIEDVDADMAVIERSIRDVIKKLDNFIKVHVYFHPEARLAQWIVQLFTDQDDYLVESMVCCLDVAVGLCYRNNAHPDLRKDLNPSVTLLQFLETVAFDTDLLLDYLVSNETCFLLYFYRILKYIRRNCDEFLYTCDERQIRDVRALLNGLRKSIERLVSKNLFPYNITPVVRLLVQCEELFAALNL